MRHPVPRALPAREDLSRRKRAPNAPRGALTLPAGRPPSHRCDSESPPRRGEGLLSPSVSCSVRAYAAVWFSGLEVTCGGTTSALTHKADCFTAAVLVWPFYSRPVTIAKLIQTNALC
ncbi:hypothetical protein NDU88_000600 [Pleurodeles waltl]|uniref:Uncharacterized protein n=1 Tax=Pleurodeles waltl TaxID=8319 RepID=A0AAV7R4M6_PLEWA|nr:hypothetical protein NDU88_000600 [Pleurodeles waltl]